MNNFSKNFKRLRKERGLTQFEIADKISMNQKSVGSYEEGRAIPHIDVLIRISDIFNISIDQLVR